MWFICSNKYLGEILLEQEPNQKPLTALFDCCNIEIPDHDIV